MSTGSSSTEQESTAITTIYRGGTVYSGASSYIKQLHNEAALVMQAGILKSFK